MNALETLTRLNGRIAFRTRWAMSNAPRRRTVSLAALAWELEYDDENNFARMGPEFVSETWGIALPPAPNKKTKARERAEKFAAQVMQAAE
ncbi:hypothetical protein [Tardiphaga sp. 11_C7_N12_6]|uniref:hypothetical protein n=1 Tax=Tardiphaga sp. 11_C7_N12_6 TaxID=3240789 RepID=UPI003F2256EC